MPASRTAARILVDQLAIHGIDHVFCVPGESYLAVLDALIDAPVTLTVCRQEGGAAMMAEAHGKLTGRPAACMVTRGPGATNAMPGLHIAQHDSIPLLLFVGQVERGVRDRGAFQELDYRATFGAVAKWVVEIDDPARIPEIVAHAVHVAMSGRPGPVVIALPEDMLVETAAVPDAQPACPTEAHPGSAQIAALRDLLAAAERPVTIVGGTRWTANAARDFAAFAEAWSLPVAASFRRQMLFPADHACYAGDLGLGCNPCLLDRIREADLILAIGTRLAEIPSQGYTLLELPTPRQRLVHVHPDPNELGRVYTPHLAIAAAPVELVAALPRPAAPVSATQAEAAHADYLAWSDPTPIRIPGALQMGEVMTYLEHTLPADAIFCNGAGNFATWVHRFHRFRAFGTQLAPTSGSMGYGVPAAVAAKRIDPARTVICFAGDGDFLMNGQEFATAVQYGLAIVVILLDNSMYGTIRMHQERHYPGRTVATDLQNPDFAAYARAFGGHGERVETTADFAPAFERAMASGRPAILHCLIDPQAITPGQSLDAIRAAARG